MSNSTRLLCESRRMENRECIDFNHDQDLKVQEPHDTLEWITLVLLYISI